MSLSKDMVCNNIKTSRIYKRRNTKSKTITFFMFYEGKFKISTRVTMQHNIKTGHVDASGCIVMLGRCIFPAIYGKQNCNDPIFVERINNGRLEKQHIFYKLNKEKINNGRREYYGINKEKINTRRRERYNEQKNRRET